MKIFYLSLDSIEKEGFLSTLFQPTKDDGLLEIEQSIVLDGLLNPITVIKNGNIYKVIDGKKRLKIIRHLSKSNRYRRSFSKVPCILREQNTVNDNTRFGRPILLNDQELAYNIRRAYRGSRSLADISKRYECDLSIAMQCLSLENLNRKIFNIFNTGTISLDQAAALSSLNDQKHQFEILLKLGPSAHASEILKAVKMKKLVVQRLAPKSDYALRTVKAEEKLFIAA